MPFRAKGSGSCCIPSWGPGSGALVKGCAWLGVCIPGSAWEAKGSGHAWEPSTGRSSSWAPRPPLPCVDLPGPPCGTGQEEGLQPLQGNSISVEPEIPSAEHSRRSRKSLATGKPFPADREHQSSGSPLMDRNLASRGLSQLPQFTWPAWGGAPQYGNPFSGCHSESHELPASSGSIALGSNPRL